MAPRHLLPVTARERLRRWLRHRPDEAVLRWVFRGLLGLALVIVGVDTWERSGIAPDGAAAVRPPAPGVFAPWWPFPGDGDRKGPARPDASRLRQPMTFELVEKGRLMAVGTITAGSAQQFAAEIRKRGGYVRTVVLDSPGGSVRDALAMGRLIRDRKFATAVEAGSTCASSCPLVFAGGVARRAAGKASIGVHQVFALATDGVREQGGMADAQQVSAEIQRYLIDMGVDLRVWMHAMATPKEKLFYFKPDELLDLRLATTVDGRSAVPRS